MLPCRILRMWSCSRPFTRRVLYVLYSSHISQENVLGEIDLGLYDGNERAKIELGR